MPGPLTKQQVRNDDEQARSRNETDDWGRFDDRFRIGLNYTREIMPDMEASATAYFDKSDLDHPIFQFLEIDRFEVGGILQFNLTAPVLFERANSLIGGISYTFHEVDEQDYVNIGRAPG